MQNVLQESSKDKLKIDAVNVPHDISNLPSTPHSTSNSSPAKSETETYSEDQRYMSDSSESEEDSVSEVESFMIDHEFEDHQVEAAKFLLSPGEDRAVDPETQARLEALLQAAGIGQLAAKDGKHLGDPEVLRRLTSSVSCALDEAAAALTRMRSDNSRSQSEKTSLVEACTDGDVGTVRKLLTEGRSVHETSEEGESLLSLACSAGYFELAQVLLAMHANVEDRGIKGECTPLMEAASAGHLDIVRLLIAHGADVNAQSTSGNTPLMYGCAGGHTEVVKFLLENGANVEDHNENGHTPLMEAASAGHVGLAKILLLHGAGINTHSNEFKESALTLACYKGHLDMVRFLLEAGADQEHKTDEMHTALMEASMDGHVEVARLLLDSGAQVNMPTDSFESPLTLAACGGHVDLAMLLIERGANIEEVNDEGYTPLMEAAREGHEEMVHLLLGQGASINAQTEETQETALTLACCGGFTEVADILLKGGADIELGASTPLMEAAQEGHLELVKFLLENGANVHAQTQTGDTALTYASENGHTDVCDLLLQYGADLEHESEGGRTPLMKACRAGHTCTAQFLISKGANVKRQTTSNDHTPLSLACAGGHLSVVELLLSHNADPNHKLKDNSTMLIEAAKGGHTNVVQLLLDYPHSLQPMMLNQHQQNATTATSLAMLPGQVGTREPSLLNGSLATQSVNYFQPTTAILQEVPEAVRIIQQEHGTPVDNTNKQYITAPPPNHLQLDQNKISSIKPVITKNKMPAVFEGNLTTAEAQQTKTQPLTEFEEEVFLESSSVDFLNKEDPNSTLVDFIKSRKKQYSIISTPGADESTTQKQQILEELQRVERELHGKQQQLSNTVIQYAMSQDQCAPPPNSQLPQMLNIDIAMQQGLGNTISGNMFPGNNIQVHSAFYGGGTTCLQPPALKLAVSGETANFAANQTPPAFYFAPLPTSVAVSISSATTSPASQPIKFQTTNSHMEVAQNTSISDRPKAKPVSKKEGKHARKPQPHPFQLNTYGQQPTQIFGQVQQSTQPQLPSPQQQSDNSLNITETSEEQTLDLDILDQGALVLKEENSENALSASILQQFQTSPARAAVIRSPSQQSNSHLEFFNDRQDCTKVTKVEVKDYSAVEDVVQTLESINTPQCGDQLQSNLQIQPCPTGLEDSLMASLANQPDISSQTDLSRVEYFTLPSNSAQVPIHALYPYEHYLAATGMSNKEHSGAIYQAGFQAGINLMQQQLACSSGTGAETVSISTQGTVLGSTSQPYVAQQTICTPVQTSCSHISTTSSIQTVHSCQIPCTQHQQLTQAHQQSTQVQAATQTTYTASVINHNDQKKYTKATTDTNKFKKGRVFRHQGQLSQGTNFQQQAHNFQIDHNSAITQYNGGAQHCTSSVISPCLDVDSETESNHDTALTLACAGGHEELVELLISRGADIEHRDKKGFTPLILAATAGHEKVVDILLNRNADIEAQSERTKDTPLSLACSGGRYEVVELLLNRNANKEHRNVSDYTPLSLAASGGYVNIIKLLLSHGAEINSRTGSKLGISPLMLAAMNGHTAAVKLLLDMGSDINAQIETNRNTALTLACFQGRHEVVSLLLDRKANVEHRAKTGLTPLMEAASGGYVDVGRVLLDKGADVNAIPVPSSRDTALTIAADKGHVRFVELLLCRGAQVEVKNKKGNSPLWLAANGGHLPVVELLYNVNADIDSQDNRKVSCLMAAFRKGHVKVVKWMVHHVTQFPSDQEMIRYITTVSDKELLEKCQECVKVIRAAKETQAAKANKNASILLEELDMEKTREESKRLAAARRRERKKKKKLEKKEERRKLLEENKKNEKYDAKKEDSSDGKEEVEVTNQSSTVNVFIGSNDTGDKEEGDSGIDANSQGSCSSGDTKAKDKRKEKKKKKCSPSKIDSRIGSKKAYELLDGADKGDKNDDKSNRLNPNIPKSLTFETPKSPAERDDFEATGSEVYVSSKAKNDAYHVKNNPYSPNSKLYNKREEGWKEVVRKSSVQAVSASETGVKKVSVPLNAISRVIGRGGSNINAIRGATGAHIEVEKQCKGQGERIITIKGTHESTKQAHSLIAALIKDPDVDILQILPRTNKTATTTTLWDKTQIGTKKCVGKVLVVTQPSLVSSVHQKTIQACVTAMPLLNKVAVSTVKPRGSVTVVTSRIAPRLMVQVEKGTGIQSGAAKLPFSQTSKGRSGKVTNQTFAAMLTETSSNQVSNMSHGNNDIPAGISLGSHQSTTTAVSIHTVSAAITNTMSSPSKTSRPTPTASAPPTMQNPQSTAKAPSFSAHSTYSSSSESMPENMVYVASPSTNIHQSMQTPISSDEINHVKTSSEYSLFYSTDQSMWRREAESQKSNFAAVTGIGSTALTVTQGKFMEQLPMQADLSKAPGYRGGTVSSPISSKTRSKSTTPPNISTNTSFPPYQDQVKNRTVTPIGTAASANRSPVSQDTQDFYTDFFKNSNIPANMLNLNANTNEEHLLPTSYVSTNNMQNLNFSPPQPVKIASVSMSRLNPKAPDFSCSVYNSLHKPPQQSYNGYPINQNNIYQMSKTGMDNYHASGINTSPNRWALMQMQQPFSQQQTELISGMAGMTIHSLARATGGEILENGDESGLVNSNNSPISPNLPPSSGVPPGDNYGEERKPQPIGTERARKIFTNQVADGNWMLGNENKSSRWPVTNLPDQFTSISRGPMFHDDIQHIDFTGGSLDPLNSYSNGPAYYNPPMGNLRGNEFLPADSIKMDLSWNASCSDQEKLHGWKKWNQ